MIHVTLHDVFVFSLGAVLGFLGLVFALVKDDIFKMYKDSGQHE
jgi:hypothetical protein